MRHGRSETRACAAGTAGGWRTEKLVGSSTRRGGGVADRGRATAGAGRTERRMPPAGETAVMSAVSPKGGGQIGASVKGKMPENTNSNTSTNGEGQMSARERLRAHLHRNLQLQQENAKMAGAQQVNTPPSAGSAGAPPSPKPEPSEPRSGGGGGTEGEPKAQPGESMLTHRGHKIRQA